MELVVLNIGLDLGVISPTVFTMLVIMALVTTFATTPVLRWVYPDQELLRDRVSVEIAPGEPAPFTVLMCVSDPTPGPGLATLSAALVARRDPPARLFALHLWHPSDRPSVEQRRSATELDSGPLFPLLGRARELGLDVRPLEFASSDPSADICRTAEAMGVSLVLLGAHKPLLLEGSLGGIVRDVVGRARTPVGVFIDRGLKQVSRVLVAYAGGPEDLAALELARRLASAPGVSLTLLHVVSPGEFGQPGRGRAQIDEVFAEPGAEGSTVRVLVIEHASPSDAVLEEASRGYELIVLGMRERWGLGTGVLSLRRQRVMAEAPVSILAVHPHTHVADSSAV
jgi:nucleotide-binding universal stress UspA family protein